MSDQRFTIGAARQQCTVRTNQIVILYSTDQSFNREFVVTFSTYLAAYPESPRRVHLKAAAWRRVWYLLPGANGSKELYTHDKEG